MLTWVEEGKGGVSGEISENRESEPVCIYESFFCFRPLLVGTAIFVG